MGCNSACERAVRKRHAQAGFVLPASAEEHVWGLTGAISIPQLDPRPVRVGKEGNPRPAAGFGAATLSFIRRSATNIALLDTVKLWLILRVQAISGMNRTD